MWNLDSDTNKWLMTDDKLTDDVLGYYKQQLSSVRFYSKSLSGATYLPVNDLFDIYDILTGRPNRDWYISFNGGSQYSNTLIPPQHATPITSTSSYDFYTKNLSEYNLTLKTLFTPYRLIKDSLKNYIYVDVATSENLPDLELFNNDRVIDGIRLKNGHKVLIKNQVTILSLPNTVDANSYFRGNYIIVQNLGATIEYSYVNEYNGIYEYRDGFLNRTNDLNEYKKSVRFSVVVKEGQQNKEKQYHLTRLRNRFYPSIQTFDPLEFIEKKNWILRNRVDYNNLFEINYYDVIKHGEQIYNLQGITYSIPERTISVGEFGVIINYQNGVQNIINNKYKVNLRSISQNSTYYWICGDEGTLLRVRKHDFLVDRISIPKNIINTSLKSISFYDDLKGVVVGDLNYILITENGGTSWERIKFEEFGRYYYNKVYYHSPFSFFVGGNTGVFIEFKKDVNGWNAIKRRISRFIDDEEEYVLVDNINDIFYSKIENWGLTFSFSGLSSSNSKELLFIVGDDSKIIAHDLNDSIPEYDFIYLDFPNKYGDIRNINREGTSNNFYFTGIDEDNLISGLFKFDISNLQYIGVGNSYSNTVLSNTNPEFVSDYYPNETFDYKGEFIICGNDSLIKGATYGSLEFKTLDETFESRLKSKMLFLDYDVASKLNFFTDQGDYRLPNPVEFIFSDTTGYYFEFDQLVYGPTSSSFITQSEHNWFEYWQDSNMTFEYYSLSPVTNNTKVITSPKFRYSSDLGVLNVSTIKIDYNSILPLAPKILETEIGRFNGFGMTAISIPTVSSDIYLYEYLMVVNLGSVFSVNVGDTFRLDSSVVSSNFVVNKIVTLSGNKYAYMFTEFNAAITRQLFDSTDPITLTNLNTFYSLDKLVERYQHHPISNGYTISLSEKTGINNLLMDFTIGGVTTSYTNWSFSGGFTTSSSFPTSIVPGSNNTSEPYSFRTDGTGLYYIETPDVKNVENISFYIVSNTNVYLSGTTSYLTVQGLSESNWQDIYTYFIPDAITGGFANSITLPVDYNYSKYKFLMFVAPTTTLPKNIRIDDINLSSNSELIISTYSYGISSSTMSALSFEPKFNNLTAYYNLATNINTNYTVSTMSYTGGFLKFGYTSTYNLLDYLESINDVGDPDPVFYADKEFYAMPHYLSVPMPGINSLSPNELYIDYNGITYSNVPTNKLLFGDNMKLLWDSLLVNTFIDIKLYDSPTYGTASSVTERLLIIDKYRVDPVNLIESNGGQSLPERIYYVIEFDRSINLTIGNELYFIDILSRRKLSQISEDLQIINNIQRIQTSQDYNTSVNSLYGASFTNFNKVYNFKINTDSYAKLMLADFETLDSLSAVVYTDYKNEFSMNITKLDQEFQIPILNTANFGGNLFILCSERHNLKTGDGVVLEFNGGTGSSQLYNPQYAGYQTVVVVNEYNFYCNIPFGNITFVGNDSGFVKYVRKDPFLNFQPVDLIEYGVDKRGRQSIEILIENTLLTKDRFSLVNVNKEKFRFRLIDGLDLDIVLRNFSWLLEAEISEAIIGQDSNGIVWYSGIWESGRWFGGTWISGSWISGDWYGGNWFSKKIKDNFISVDIDDKSSDNIQSTWFSGRWYDGTWNSGTWINGRWYDGTWNTGEWYKGIWNDGTWLNGLFLGGIWVTGTWQRGKFNCDNEPAYWLDGEWYGGDFENGMWYNGTWQEKNTASRFGVKAYNSRTATWQSGKWLSGSFHSKENIDEKGLHQTSEAHRYSIWKTGTWQSGDFYGGIAYNIDFKSGIWYGGILEDIQVIGFTGSTTTSENYFTVNGIFKFNIGDSITFIDNQIENVYSSDFGSNTNPKSYKILYTVEDPINKWTDIYVDRQIITSVLAPVDLGLRVVSTFRNCNWKSGIWTNGIYEAGLWEGGIWYGGIFGQNAIWM